MPTIGEMLKLEVAADKKKFIPVKQRTLRKLRQVSEIAAHLKAGREIKCSCEGEFVHNVQGHLNKLLEHPDKSVSVKAEAEIIRLRQVYGLKQPTAERSGERENRNNNKVKNTENREVKKHGTKS